MALPQTTSHQENFPDNFKSRDAENLELVKVIPFGTQKSTKKKGSKKTKNKGKKTSKATNPHERAGLQLRQMAGYKGLGILYFMPAVCVISRILGYSQKYSFV